MALITCPECGKEISDKARCCPNCGYKRVKRNQHIKKNVIILLLIMGVFLITGGIYKFSQIKKVQSMTKQELLERNQFNTNVAKSLDDDTKATISNFIPLVSEWYDNIDVTQKQSLNFIKDEMFTLGDKIAGNRYVVRYLEENSTDKQDEINYKHVSYSLDIVTILLELVDNSTINYAKVVEYTTDDVLNSAEVVSIMPYLEELIEQRNSIIENNTYGDNTKSVASLMEEDIKKICDEYNIILDGNMNIVTKDDVPPVENSTISLNKAKWEELGSAIEKAVNYYFGYNKKL